MTHSPKFIRLVAEFEIEVVDPLQAASFTMDWGVNEETGEPVIQPPLELREQMRAAVGEVVFNALHTRGAAAGFRWHAGTTMLRPVDETGEKYVTFPLPEMPVRRDDGTFPGLDDE